MAKWFLPMLTIAAVAVAIVALAAEHESSDAALAQVAINVADLERSEKYYCDVLGFKRDPDGYEIELYQAASQ